MRSPSDAENEAQVLMSEPGHALLGEVSAISRPRPADLARWRKTHTADFLAAALRLVDCRRRAEIKFSRASSMWLESTGLQQATSELVAKHKATRFRAAPLVVDLCSGIGGDAIALAERSDVIAVDADHAMGRRLNWNARVYERSTRVLSVSSRAEQFGLPAQSHVHIDPDRRASDGDHRAREIADYVPSVDHLVKIMAKASGGAIKLGPGSDFDRHFSNNETEVEIISLAGECKEATIWFGDLATCRRRATVLPSGLGWTEQDGAGRAESHPLSQWLYDPDPALTRSGLLDGFAVAHALGRPFPGIDLLTSDVRMQTPWLQEFEVGDVLPFDIKTLRRLVARRGLGPLEIKPRGIALKPEELRLTLRPGRDRAATIFVVRDLLQTRAIVARRPVN